MNMQLVTADQQYNSLVECNYSHPQEAFDDVTTVATRFPKLQVYVDYYFYPNKEKKKLVNLAGTVPITYDGSLYNIPVRIWIHETHPKNPPRCYVCPASSTVVNTKSSNVDESGCVLLHCLKNWKTGRSNLSVVLEEMIAAFQHETPLFARSLLPSEEVQASQVSCSSWPHGDSCFAQEPSQAQHGPSVLSATQSGGSSVCSKSAKSPNCLDQARRKNMSGGKRHTSYTQELLDFGITFGAQDHQTNPFISAAPASSNRTSNSDDVDDLFKGLNLQSDVDVNQFDCRDKHGTEAGVGLQDCAGGLPVPPVLVDSYNKVVVSGLPVGASPGRIKNKLTIYFQRKNNAGREVLDVRYPALQPDQAWVFFRNQEDAKHILKQPERTFEINEQQCVIRLTQSEDVEIPDGVQGEKAEMFKSIMSLGRCGFRSEDILEAVQSCRDISSALNYLCHDCPICQEQVSFNRMVTMTHCSCTFCENCFKKYFSSVIKEKSIVHVVCPICNLPDVRGCRREESMEYFSLLDTQIKYYLDPQIHELFQRKLRDKALQEIPNFRWCAHCCFGLLHEADRLRMDCPSCRKSTCFQCKKPWAPQHEGISCEKFKEWEQINCPEYQNSKLEQILSRNKIDCPKCKFRFLLARGGCLHFKCTQCQHEFCGGCSRPFKQGSACDFSSECGAKGLHAHHPRDCLYHLRDWSVPRLRNLLQFYGMSHSLMFSPKCPTERHFKGTCGVMEFQETSAVKEEPCGRPAFPEYSGYCMVHYKECLVELINQNSMDPVVLLDRVELCTEMARWKVQLPVKLHSETDLQYDDRLRQILKERVGLVYAGPSGLQKATAPTPSPSSPPAAAAPGTAWFSMLSRPVSEDSVQLLLLTD